MNVAIASRAAAALVTAVTLLIATPSTAYAQDSRVDIGSGVIDNDRVLGPRWQRLDFVAQASGTQTVSVTLDGDADIRFNVFETSTGDRLATNLDDNRIDALSVDLEASVDYFLTLWSVEGAASYTATVDASPVAPPPPVSSLVIGEDTIDADFAAGPRSRRVSFTGLADAVHTITVAWDSDADVRFSVIETATNTRLNTVPIEGTNPGLWSGELRAGVSYFVNLWSVSGAANFTATLDTGDSLPLNITEQPSNVTLAEGESANFSVSATSGSPITYQWFADGSEIAGATARTLVVENVELNDSGTAYTVMVSDNDTTLLSDAALLTVEPSSPPPTTGILIGENTVDADFVLGPRSRRVTFDALADDVHTVTVAWNSDADVRFSVFEAATNTRLNAVPVEGSNPGVWSGELIAGNTYFINLWTVSGAATFTATLDVDLPDATLPFSLLEQPSDVTVTEGDTASFSVIADSDSPISYQWFADGVEIPGATDSTLNIEHVLLADSGTIYTVTVSDGNTSLTSDNAILTVEPPPRPTTSVVIGQGSLDDARVLGPRSITINFTALSTSTHTISVAWDSDADLRYNVFDATTGERLNADVGAIRGANPGVWSGELQAAQPYRISLWAASGSANYTATIDAFVPILIEQQPANLSVIEGSKATFLVEVSGSGPFTYQWFADDTAIPDQTAPVLELATTLLAEDGTQYSVDISNGVDTVRSEAARLTVSPVPVLGTYSTDADTAAWTLAGPAPVLDFTDTRPGDAWGRRLLQIGDVLLVGGDFTGVTESATSLEVISRPYLAALDATTGQPVESFTVPSEVDSVVRALVLSPSGAEVYVGGDFGVVVLDAETGALIDSITVLDGALPGRVFDIAVTNTDVYLGGDFSNVNGTFRANVARLSLDGEVDSAWAPNVTNGFPSGRAAPVQAITVSPHADVVYIGGNYSFIDGFAVPRSAADRDISMLAVSALDGSVLPALFIPFTTVDRDVFVHDIAVTDDYVIISWGGPNVLTFHLPDGTRLQQYRGTGDIQALEVVGNHVLVGHHGEFFGFLPNPIPAEALVSVDPEVIVPHRLHSFRLDTADFAPGQAFITESPFGIWGIAASPEGIWVTGQIESAGTNAHPVDGLARFPAISDD